MLVNFEELPESARLWIYQSDTLLSAEQEQFIAKATAEFCNQWSAHSTPLHSAFKLLNNKFLLLAVDEGVHQASGCSIDSSVRFVRLLEQKLGLNFFNRTQVAFISEDEITVRDFKEIKNEILNGNIGKDTLTFNLQAQTLGDFNSNWLVPAGESWMKKYF